MTKLFLGLLVFVPITIIAQAMGVSPAILFFLAAVAIIPLAKYIGEATEELAGRTNPALGGFLNATFGNATEIIIGLFALNAGLIDEKMFVALVVMAIVTSMMSGPLMKKMLN